MNRASPPVNAQAHTLVRGVHYARRGNCALQYSHSYSS